MKCIAVVTTLKLQTGLLAHVYTLHPMESLGPFPEEA